MVRVNKNSKINAEIDDIIINRIHKKNFHIKKKETKSYLIFETEPNLLIKPPRRFNTEESDNNNTIPNESYNITQFQKDEIKKKFIEESKEKNKIEFNKFINLKKKLKEDANFYYNQKNNLEIPILPIIKGSKIIKNNYRRNNQLSISNLKNKKKLGEVNNFDLTNQLFKSYEPKISIEKELNYLAIKEFYNQFKGIMNRKKINKK